MIPVGREEDGRFLKKRRVFSVHKPKLFVKLRT
jgi:hypothetical protein